MRRSDSGTPGAFFQFLVSQNIQFACAESCTGGMIAQQLTSLAGSSAVFWGGVVSYSNQAKTELLGVNPHLIETHGAVSAEVALAMALGLSQRSGADLNASVTGIAGPTGGSDEKPIGTVWLGLASAREGQVKAVAVKHRFEGTRQQIRSQAAQWTRRMAQCWWQSNMELDSLRSLADNAGKPFVEAFQTLPFQSPQKNF